MERERLETDVSEDQDRLIDVLLREELGGETPPDLAGKILSRAFTERKRGPRPIIAAAGEVLSRAFPERVPRFAIATAAAIAAVLTLAVVGWMALESRSPAPEVLEAPAVAETDEPAPEVLEAPKVVEADIEKDEPAPEALEAPKVAVTDKPAPEVLEAPKVAVTDKPAPEVLEASKVVKADKPVPEALEAPRVVKADKPVPEVLEAPKVVKADKPAPEALEAPRVKDDGKVTRPCLCGHDAAVIAADKAVAGSRKVKYSGESRKSTTKKYSGGNRVSTTKKYSGESRKSTTKKYSGKSRVSTTKKHSGKDRKLTVELGPHKSECGFRGRVLGAVVEDGRENSFAFKVVRVLRVRKSNEAENPKALAGRTVRVGPSFVRGEDGKWHHVELHRAFINSLRKRQKFALDIWSCKRGVFAIMELSGKQRKWAEQEKKKQDMIIMRERRVLQ